MHVPSDITWIAALASAGCWGIWGRFVGGIVALVAAGLVLVLGLR
jgi:hypothetical protein